MADSEDDWIKKRAYALWEEEGKPHGKNAEHWEQARREYSAFALKPARRPSRKAGDVPVEASEATVRKPSAKKSAAKASIETPPSPRGKKPPAGR